MDEIEYDEHDDEPVVELDEVAVVRRDEQSKQDTAADIVGPQSTDIHQNADDQNGVVDDRDAIDQNTRDNEYIVGGRPKHVRHDSGSYSTNGENGNGADDGVVNDGGDAGEEGVNRVQVDVSVHEVDLGLINMAAIDGLPQNTDYEV